MDGSSAFFATPGGSVQVDGLTPDLMRAFRHQAPEWPAAAGDDRDSGCAGHVSALCSADGWTFSSSRYATPDFRFPDGLVAGNGLVGCLIHTFVAASDRWIALHAGAVEIDGGLTVLAGDMMAGKSTLTLALASLGRRVWCDDRLPVTEGPGGYEGVALHLRPKTRMPLPANAPDHYCRYLDDRKGPSEADMQYVILGANELAPHGASRPIRRIVLLDRAATGPVAARPVSLGEAVKQMIPCTFAPHLGPVGVLDRLRMLVQSTTCLSLRYSSSFEAADWLHAGDGTS